MRTEHFQSLDLVASGTSSDHSLAELAQESRKYFDQSKAAGTKKAYQKDWAIFTRFCVEKGLTVLPATPDTVALFITHLADTGKKVATIGRRLSSIAVAHDLGGFESPTKSAMVRVLMAGVRRSLGTAQVGKAPLMSADIRAMLACLPDNLKGKRDRALILMGFSAALRRSELVGLEVGDIEFTHEGMILTIRRSKTDQEGQGHKIGIPHSINAETCAVVSLKRWLETSEIAAGRIFRGINRHGSISGEKLSGNAVAVIIQELCSKIGLDPSRFGGHSLRAGFSTQAAASGASERSIQNQTRHRSLTTLRKYIRHGSLFRENAASVLGL